MIRKRTTLTEQEKRQRLIFALFAVIAAGAGLGAGWMLLQKTPDMPGWCRLIGCFDLEDHLAGLWTSAVAGAALFLGCLFLIGFSAVGQPGIILLLLCYGFCLGCSLRMQCGGVSGALHCLMLLPYDVPLSALMAAAAREALRFAGRFTAYGFRDEPTDNMEHQLRLYCTRFAVLGVFVLLLALLYSLGFLGLTMAEDKLT